MTIFEAKAALDKECTKLAKLLAWDETKVTRKAEAIRRSQIRRRIVRDMLSDCIEMLEFVKIWNTRSTLDS